MNKYIKEFLEGQNEYTELKEQIIENAIAVKHDVSLFDTHSEKVLNELEKSILNLFKFYQTKHSIPEIPKHYKGNQDVIQFLQEEVFIKEDFVSSMVFNIVKYTTRLGRKDNIKQEIQKIYTYYYRLKEGIYYYENE